MIDPDAVTKMTMITGPRGSCKTLFMTTDQMLKLIRYYIKKLLTGEEWTVWSNYPVGFYYNSPTGEMVYLQPKPLNMQAFYIFDKGLAKGTAYIDEIDQWYDNANWQAVTSRLLNAGLTQIRKKKLSISATIQDFAWLDKRGRFQTDIIVSCRESAFTPWGREHHLGLGEAAFLKFMDKSGIMTGYTFDETNRYYQKIFFGKNAWNCYDTSLTFDPMETVGTKYKMKKRELLVDFSGEQKVNPLDEEPGAIHPGSLKSPVQNPDHVILSHLVDEFAKAGTKRLKTSKLWEEAIKRGIKGNKTELGRWMSKELGVEKVGSGLNYYSFEKTAAMVG